MENFDIIIYAGIAAFLFYRLWSVLGQDDGSDTPAKKKTNPFNPMVAQSDNDDENVVILEGRAKKLHSDVLTGDGHALTSLAGILDLIKIEDPSFEEKSFLEGAKIAFTGIVKAFANGDLNPVKRFLGPAVLLPFTHAMEARHKAEQTLKNSIEKIVAADIVDAKIEKEEATITVEFISYQVNQLFEKDGTTKDSDKPEEIRDRWVFRRLLKTENPNWLLIETQS